MLDAKFQQVAPYWTVISEFLYYPHNEEEYEKAVRLLDDLIDTVGGNENHPLASLMEILGLLIEKYEDEHVQEITEI